MKSRPVGLGRMELIFTEVVAGLATMMDWVDDCDNRLGKSDMNV